MGYIRKPTIFVLKFTDPDYEGLVVKAKSPNMGVFFDVAKIMEMDTQQLAQDDMKLMGELFEYFADSLVEWNLEDETGEPVAMTVAGLKSQDLDFVLTMVMAWFSAISGVRKDLPQPSENGEPSQGALIPMELLSQSHAS